MECVAGIERALSTCSSGGGRGTRGARSWRDCAIVSPPYNCSPTVVRSRFRCSSPGAVAAPDRGLGAVVLVGAPRRLLSDLDPMYLAVFMKTLGKGQ
jgi:hypothetical protein